MCMPWREEHRKAVCGNWGWQGFCEAKTRKTARTVARPAKAGVFSRR